MDLYGCCKTTWHFRNILAKVIFSRPFHKSFMSVTITNPAVLRSGLVRSRVSECIGAREKRNERPDSIESEMENIHVWHRGRPGRKMAALARESAI